MKTLKQRPALGGSLIYALIGILWIVISDAVVNRLVESGSQVTLLQTSKGWLFITITAALLYLIMRWGFRQQLKLTERLRLNELVFQAGFEQSRTGICHLDIEGRLIRANPALCELLGYPSGALNGMLLADLLLPGMQDNGGAILRRLARGEQDAGQAESPYRRADGSPLWCQTTITPIVTGSGDLLYYTLFIEDISQRRAAEALQRDSKRRFRAYFDQVPAGIAVISTDGRWLEANKHLRAFLDCSQEDLFSLPWSRLVHPEDREACDRQMLDLSTGVADRITQETRLVCKNGQQMTVSITARSIRGVNGQPESIIILVEDIAARKEVEQRLLESEERYHSLVEASPIPILVHTDGRIVFANEAAVRIAGGVSTADLVGRNVMDFVHPDNSTLMYERMQNIYSGKTVENRDVTLTTSDGRMVEVELLGAPVRFRGRPSAQVILQDVGTRRKNEEALQRFNARLAALYQISQSILSAQSPYEIATGMLQQIDRLIAADRIGVVMFDFGSEEVIPLALKIGSIAQPGPLASIPLYEYPLQDSLWEGQFSHVDDLTMLSELERSPMTDRWSADGMRSYTIFPMLIQGRLIGALHLAQETPGPRSVEELSIARELTDQIAVAINQADLNARIQRHTAELEQRVAERTRELAEANTRLQELDRLKSKFVADVSHELRTPITNLSMYLHLLERTTAPRKRSQYAEVLNTQVTRLARLVEGILDVSRLDLSTRNRVAFSPVRLNLVVEQIASANRPRIETAGLTLDIDLMPELPDVWGEPNQLAQVVANLLNNAVNYTPAGQIILRTGYDERRGNVYLTVSDTGIGIEAEDLPHLFDRFYRGHQPEGLDIPGTGLGLGIVKEIVDLHQGTIVVESTPGSGSTFTVSLPLLGGRS